MKFDEGGKTMPPGVAATLCQLSHDMLWCIIRMPGGSTHLAALPCLLPHLRATRYYRVIYMRIL